MKGQSVAIEGAPIPSDVQPSSLYRGGASPPPAFQNCQVVRPRSVAEVQSLLKWATRSGVALATFSSSPGPRRRGLTSSSPALIVDLSRMKRLYHVDPNDAVAIVEPGLTFDELDRALSQHGLRSFKPLLPRAGKSVLASYLERESLTAPRDHWDVLDPFGSAEIVFGNGERFSTGTAGNPGSMDDHWKAGMRYTAAMGPVGTDFMRVLQGSQGTLGIVTWAAIFCDRVPAVEQSFFIGSNELEPLQQLSSALSYRKLGHATFIMNRRHYSALAKACGVRVDIASIPPWILYVNVAGLADLPEERVAYEHGDITALAQAAGLRLVPEIGRLEASALTKRQAALPEGDYKDDTGAGYEEVFFLTQVDRAARFVAAAWACAAEHGHSVDEIGVYVQPRLQGRNCHLEFIVPGRSAHKLAAAIAAECCALGGLFSRPYGPWVGMAYDRNPALVPYLRQTKSMLDPAGVLNPGRLGF